MNANPSLLSLSLLSILFCVASTAQDGTSPTPSLSGEGLRKLEYNNPGLLVDLDVGFKSVPLPMDFDGDGDLDLIVSESGSYTESGLFYFENISGNVEMPVFRHSMRLSSSRFRLGYDGARFEVSDVNGRIHVLTPDRVGQTLLIYKDVPQNVFWDRNEIRLPPKGIEHLRGTKFTQWKMIDFDGDGIRDLVCAANELLFLKNTGNDENPRYADPVTIKTVAGAALGKGTAIRTLFADFDNDGDFDYIGMRDSSFIYFENTGTETHYRFSEGEVIKHRGASIKMLCRATIHPTAIDWDRDGLIDIIAGDEDGKVSFLKNTGKEANGIPRFLPPRFFQQEARFVDFGALSAPRVFDWDGDGLDDIVSGNGVGHIGFIRNLGGERPTWAAPELLEADGIPIRILPEGAL